MDVPNNQMDIIMVNHWLVVWNHGILWRSIYWEFQKIPTDEVHHFSEGRAQPPTSHCQCDVWSCRKCGMPEGERLAWQGREILVWRQLEDIKATRSSLKGLPNYTRPFDAWGFRVLEIDFWIFLVEDQLGTLKIDLDWLPSGKQTQLLKIAHL